MVYKPMDEIVGQITDTVKIESVIRPIYNFKASKFRGEGKADNKNRPGLFFLK